MFRRSFRYNPERVAEVMALQERRAITDPRCWSRCLVVLALVVVGFGAARRRARGAVDRRAARRGRDAAGVPRWTSASTLREVEWPTLVFFIGLFVMVGGLVAHRRHRHHRHLGGRRRRRQLLRRGHRAAVRLRRARRLLRQHPVRRHHGPDRRRAGRRRRRTPAPGRRCGGPSRSAPTSAATAPRSRPAPTWWPSASPPRSGHPISFWQFTRYGILVTVVSSVMAWVYVWLRYFA